MSLLSKKRPTASFVFFLLLSVSCISCNKGSDKATTTIKCVTCVNGGSCINDTCRCPAGYEGTTCQTQSRQKFVRDWEVTETSAVFGPLNYVVFIQSNSNIDLSSVMINDLYQNSFGSIEGHVSGDSIYIPTQTQSNKTVVGVGFIHSGNQGANSGITLRYQVTDLTTGITDDFGYNSSDGTNPSQWQGE